MRPCQPIQKTKVGLPVLPEQCIHIGLFLQDYLTALYYPNITYMKYFFIAVLMYITFSVSAQTSGKVRKVKDFIIYKDSSYYSTFPTVVKKEDGELILAFRRAPNRQVFGESKNDHVDPNSFLVTVRSRDNGLSWSKEPELLYAHPWGGSHDP